MVFSRPGHYIVTITIAARLEPASRLMYNDEKESRLCKSVSADLHVLIVPTNDALFLNRLSEDSNGN